MRSIPSTLFNEWLAFHELFPSNDDHICDYIRQLTYYVCLSAGIKKDPNDLVIRYGETPQERMRRKFSMYMSRMGKKVKGS